MSVETLLLFGVSVINHIIPKKDNRIFFYSSPDYSDNARAIYEELIRSNKSMKYDIVWAVKDYERYKKQLQNVTVVKHRSLKNLWFFCRSHYLIRTHSLWGNRHNAKKQIMCVAWHGMPIKKLIRSGDSRPKRIKCDYVLSTSEVFDNELSNTMGIPLSLCKHTGLPRNDSLFNDGDELSEKYPGFSKRIIWMPTFRSTNTYSDGKDNELGMPIVDSSNINRLNDSLKTIDVLLIIKLHPWCLKNNDGLVYSNIVFLKDSDINPNDTLYKLLGQTDALITDYSSVFVDYLLTNKPICFALDDLDEYRSSRGFVFEPIENYLPGEIVTNIDSLITWIQRFDTEDDFIECRNELKRLFHNHCDGYSSKRVVELMGL